MRIVHFDPPIGTIPFVPVCGSWGEPDSDGTKEPRGVTCPACRLVMDRVDAAAPVAVSVPFRPA